MSDRPKRLSHFEIVMMEMHTQERPKACDNHWRYFSFGAKVCSKCNECEHDWKKVSNGIRVYSKCHKFIEHIPNFSHYHVLSDEEYSRCLLIKRNTYTKEKHFNDTLDIFLGHKSPNESVTEFARSLPNNITKAEIRQEIKRQRKTVFTRFLRNIH